MFLSLALLPTLLLADQAAARTITVLFAYAGTADGFRLYQNGIQVCEELNGSVRTMECDVTVGTDDRYTLTAITGETESPESGNHFFGRVRNIYKQMRGGSFAGGSM